VAVAAVAAEGVQGKEEKKKKCLSVCLSGRDMIEKENKTTDR